MQKFINRIYYSYYTRNSNILLLLHKVICSNVFITRLIFNFKIVVPYNPPTTYKFDLTTYLIKNILQNYFIDIDEPKVLEIGTGLYGILSIYCYRNFSDQVTAIDIRKTYIENSIINAKVNNAKINFIKSDLFKKVKINDFDLVFWNLPYYSKKEKYLIPLIEQAHNYLTPGGIMLLGYNSFPLKEKDVIELVNGNGSLIYYDAVKYHWNNHIISVIKKKA